MTSPELKIHLINMAEAWAALASQSERIATLCAAMPDGGTTPLAPEIERASGGNANGAVESPALSPAPHAAEPARGDDQRR